MRSLVLIAVVVAAGVLASPTNSAVEPKASQPKARTFELTYKAAVEGLPEAPGLVRIWIPYLASDEAQEVEVIRVSSRYPTRVEKEPEFGNWILFVEVENPAETSLTVELTARVRRTERLSNGSAGHSIRRRKLRADVAKWLEPDRLVPLNPRIRGIAAQVTKGKASDLEKARAIYDYVVDTMSYDKSGEGWGRGDIYWACDLKRGNCTDFHALFTGLSRAAGIPAKFAIGLPLPETRGEGEISGYHCWAEFWLEGYGWIPVDASEAWKHPAKRDYFFGAHDENRVELSEGRDIVLAPTQNGEPVNFFVYPYVEVAGRPWDRVSRRFTYRDLAETLPMATSP